MPPEGFEPSFSTPFFNEFSVDCPQAADDIRSELQKRNIMGGFDLGRFYGELEDSLMFCVTEMNPIFELQALVEALS